MQIVRRLNALWEATASWRSAGETIALVPTMGALHGGHMALLEEAKRRADRVVATIFVNPLQFGLNEDLGAYPRREAADVAMLEERGCDLLWMPTEAELYPTGFATTVSVSGISERWDGAARPGHFDGVATVVAKFFAAVQPSMAIFGEKDFQQLAVIRRMNSDLGLRVDVVAAQTVRDADGLALSSRNAYLSKDERKRAAALPDALKEARGAVLAGMTVDKVLSDAKARLGQAGFGAIDYFALVDAGSLEPIDIPKGEMRLIAAARMGTARLIDNIEVLQPAK